MLEFDVRYARPFLPANWLSSRLDGLTEARQLLENGEGLGGEFTGLGGSGPVLRPGRGPPGPPNRPDHPPAVGGPHRGGHRGSYLGPAPCWNCSPLPITT